MRFPDDDLLASDLLPEFRIERPLIDGERYVVAHLGQHDALTLFCHQPRYREAIDSWEFDDHSVERKPDDCWMPADSLDGAFASARARRDLRVTGIFTA